MKNNLTPFDVKKTIKKGLIFLLIALPFMSVVAVLLTIAKAQQWLTMMATVVTGGIVVFICYVVSNSRAEKKKAEKDNKFDPFKDWTGSGVLRSLKFRKCPPKWRTFSAKDVHATHHHPRGNRSRF